MLQFMHIQLLSSTLELMLNQALAMGNQPSSALTQLQQKSLAVELEELHAILCLTVSEEKILITSPQSTHKFDCQITTSIKTLVQLKNEQQLTKLIKEGQLDISGDIKVAQHYAALFESLNIDWASELEKHIGDIATHKLIQLSRGLKDKVAFAQRQIEMDASEYIVYEKRLVATHHDISDFALNVTQVTNSLHAIEQRFEQLSNKLAHIHSFSSEKG